MTILDAAIVIQATAGRAVRLAEPLPVRYRWKLPRVRSSPTVSVFMATH